MFEIFEKGMKFPIKVWLENRADLEDGCLEQAVRLGNLPFVHKWISLMPDTHVGMGMPIGGVVALDNVVIPNAVGVDIGCGMIWQSTDVKVLDIKKIITDRGDFIHTLVNSILRDIPVGFNRHKTKQPCLALDKAKKEMYKYESDLVLVPEIEAGYVQVGTLGGGNHFIEIQEDDEGYLSFMIHSGSRHFGNQICNYFHDKARQNAKKWGSNVPDEWRLAYLPADSFEGQQYINWMNLALDFAYENRATMLNKVRSIFDAMMAKHTNIKFEYGEEINCHHNYASLETHYNKKVWVHRKGATRANKGEKLVIPGAMGSFSYICEGLGNPISFNSSSHGAGRTYSRKGAMDAFSKDEVLDDLKSIGVILGKHNKKDVAEESRFAYKDIGKVMDNQKDLVKIIKRLKTVGVVKG